MSNLSELLPTGGGQNAVDFVASGTLSSGQTVALNSDGTVEAVASDAIPQELGSAVVFESATANYNSIIFDPNANKVVIAYSDGGNSNYGTAVVGTVSGTSISFGTPVIFESADSRSTSATYDSANAKIVIVYKDHGNSRYGTAIVGTVSGTSISFGTAAVFETAEATNPIATYASAEEKIVIAYRDEGNSNYGTSVVGTVSGTSISFGTPVVFQSSRSEYFGSTYDSNSNKVVITYKETSVYGTAVVGTISGTSISFGTPVVFGSNSIYFPTIFDSNSNKVIVAYSDIGNGRYGTAIVGTVSGSSISFGTAVVFAAASVEYVNITFDPNANKVVAAYRDDTGGRIGKLATGVVSGTSISFGSPVAFDTAGANYNSLAFDSTSNKVVIAYQDEGNLDYGTAIVLQNESSNVADFIGITAEAISDTATGAVNVYGGINEAQTGLTIGSDYYVQADGSLSTTASAVKVGQAISATTINMMDLT